MDKSILSNSRGMDGWMQRFSPSILLLLWPDPSVLQVSEEIMKDLHSLCWLLHRNCVLRHAMKEGQSFEMQLPRIGSVTWCLHGLPVLAGLFEFTPRKNTILNIGGAWFALMFLWTFCKELEFSYFVAQPHGFKRQTWWSVSGHGRVSCECDIVVFQEILVQGHL